MTGGEGRGIASSPVPRAPWLTRSLGPRLQVTCAALSPSGKFLATGQLTSQARRGAGRPQAAEAPAGQWGRRVLQASCRNKQAETLDPLAVPDRLQGLQAPVLIRDLQQQPRVAHELALHRAKVQAIGECKRAAIHIRLGLDWGSGQPAGVPLGECESFY